MTERITILYLFLLRVANLGLYSQKLGDQMIFIVRSCWQILYSQSKIRCTYQIFINRIIFFASVIVEKFHKNTPDQHTEDSEVILNIFISQWIIFVEI